MKNSNDSAIVVGVSVRERAAELVRSADSFDQGVRSELVRQYKKWGIQDHPLAVWYLILAEEVGEIAKAILEGNHVELQREIHQVGAILIQMEATNDCAL